MAFVRTLPLYDYAEQNNEGFHTPFTAWLAAGGH